MSVTLRAEAYEVELEHWYEARRTGARPISDAAGALDLVSRLWTDPEARVQLRDIAGSTRGSGTSPLDDDRVCEWIAELIAAGELFVVTRHRPAVTFQAPHHMPLVDLSDDPEPLVPAPPEEPAANWIAFQVLDDTGEPATGVRLRLVGPDGSAQELSTDIQGEVLLPDVPKGTFDLEWVEDQDTLEVVAFS